MKQRRQIISESLHSIATSLDQMREDAFDLDEAGIDVADLNAAIKAVELWCAAERDALNDGNDGLEYDPLDDDEENS